MELIRLFADKGDTEIRLPTALLADKFFSHQPNGPRLWAALMRALSLPEDLNPSVLGVGTRGTAYDVGQRALKITYDHTEARACAIVRDTPDHQGCVVQVDRVIIVEGEGAAGKSSVYAILMERLLPPLPAWKEAASLWPDNHNITPDTVAAFAASNDMPVPDDFIGWLTHLATYLASVQIGFSDLHPGNLMRRHTGEHVLIDLGFSTAPGRVVDLADDTVASMLDQAADILARFGA